MSVWMVGFVREPVVVHDLAADESLERKGSEHVEAEEEARNIDHEIVVWKIVKHIAERFVAKGEVTEECHDETCDQGDTGAVVGYA